ncbi:cysteine desulfurase family protein [Cytobacillus gottheilii]|uniref:Cysteine desulfurase n=1 Tax=Cytobacillus gottheilii TaxID=859144 RepID=A0ABX8F9A9_9BACI|nr:cysteine desulfurase family protein [Cytobacillus gottheilii]QVY60685.1 cysteine desulfurase [Cytobacillus gottheilii]
MIYFDNSATTKPYKEAIQSFVKVSEDYYGNPSSLHSYGAKSEKLLAQAREQMANLLKVDAQEIIFTSGGTEGNNLAIKGGALAKRGKHLITTEIEHPSVKEAMKQLQKLGYQITFIPVDADGIVDIEDIRAAITNDTVLVSVMHVNNEVGSIQPIHEIGQMLKNYPDILFHVDHVQGIGKVPLNIKHCHIDLCTISAHKFHGLKGTGALYIRKGVKISPLFSGGSQEQQLRSGTENLPGSVAMAKALRMELTKQETESSTLSEIKRYIIEELGVMEGITIHTPANQAAPHIINFSISGMKAEVFVHALAEHDIYVSTTSACSSKSKAVSQTLLAMGVHEELAKRALRVSLSYDNTLEEAHLFINAVKKTITSLRKVMK